MKTKKWNKNNIPDQTGRVIIVTGASSGIGFETAKALAEKGGTVVLAVRNTDKGNEAYEKIRSAFPVKLVLMPLDLADLKSVKKFAAEFKANFDRLDLLINNAGVMIPPYSKTKDGFELQMGTNHLGHFALTALLFDLIKKTPNSRIVNVSSVAHKWGKIDFSDINWEKRKYKPMQAYGDSKLANLYFTSELKRNAEKVNQSVIVAAAHPGWSATALQRHSSVFSFFNNFLAQSPKMGALPTLYAAIANDVNSGDFFGPSGLLEWRGYPQKVQSNELSRDASVAEKLWEVSENLTKIKFVIGKK
ncbi:MAG: SDR family NAD(P)-dependent oxidoreductase [Calditrichaeota bacterium]|nr:SDR family NAD(P)-dependent oxidoreductase [Calditrichota bacterium]